jgi:hypothetical protein
LGATFFPFSQGWGPLFLFLDEKIKFAKRKIKAASERAETPAIRLNGNKLAALKQISVFIAFSPAFLNARPPEAVFLCPARLRHCLPSSLLPPFGMRLLFLSPCRLACGIAYPHPLSARSGMRLLFFFVSVFLMY